MMPRCSMHGWTILANRRVLANTEPANGCPGHTTPCHAMLYRLIGSRAVPIVRIQAAWPSWPLFGRTTTLNAAD
jgi:hypothetical protein